MRRTSNRSVRALPLTGLLLAPAAVLADPGGDGRGPEAVRAALGDGVDVVWPERAPRPTALTRLDLPLAGVDPVDPAEGFVRRQEGVLGLRGITLRAGAVTRSRRQVVVRMQQMHDGVPVYQRGVSRTTRSPRSRCTST